MRDYYSYCLRYDKPGCCLLCDEDRKEEHRTGYDGKCMCFDMMCSKCDWLENLGDFDPDTGRSKNTCTHPECRSWYESSYSKVVFHSIIRETDDALLIRFDTHTENWVPKSVFNEPDEIQDWFIDQYGLTNCRYRRPRRNKDSIIITVGEKEFVAKRVFKGEPLQSQEYIIVCPICHRMYVADG